MLSGPGKPGSPQQSASRVASPSRLGLVSQLMGLERGHCRSRDLHCGSQRAGSRAGKDIEMKLGLHVSNFTWPGGPTMIARHLARVAKAAEEQGFTKLSVMDHVWQIGHIGPPEHEMLEAYTTLGFLAGQTERIELPAWVTAVVYREPGLPAQ